MRFPVAWLRYRNSSVSVCVILPAVGVCTTPSLSPPCPLPSYDSAVEKNLPSDRGFCEQPYGSAAGTRGWNSSGQAGGEEPTRPLRVLCAWPRWPCCNPAHPSALSDIPHAASRLEENVNLAPPPPSG